MNFNNKGMTLVELIVTFALLLVVVVGLYNLILEVKFEVDEKQIVKNTVEFSALVNNDIHYDLLKEHPFAFAIKTSKDADWSCEASSGSSCSTLGTTVSVQYKTKGFNRGKELISSNSCKNIFPCVVYFYTHGQDASLVIKSKVIALGSVDGNTNGNVPSPLGTSNVLNENGILYGDLDDPLFEPVEPYDEKGYVEVRNGEHYDADNNSLVDSEDKPYIKFKDGMLIINYALYIVDDDDNKNYGFKIVYPFS